MHTGFEERKVDMPAKANLEQLFVQHGFNDFRWIKARDIKVSQWVRFRCLFGCSSRGGACPPNVPSIQECREFIAEYEDVALFRLEKAVAHPEDRKPWSRENSKKLVELERQVFLAGYYKAFLMGFDSCGYCADCPGARLQCKLPKLSRPGADALGVDVFATVRAAGYPIEVLKEYTETMNRYAFLLVE
jgi:predicted metal-binding protein